MFSVKEPQSYVEAKTDLKWIEAMNQELNTLEKNGTWIFAELPARKQAIKYKWVFKIKHRSNGDIERYKARLVVKGLVRSLERTTSTLFHQWPSCLLLGWLLL